MLRIVTLVQTGTTVKAGEPVVEFDPADQQYALEQAKSELAEAEQEIVKMKADAAVQGAQDDVALLTARFDVRRAELDASGNEFIGALDAQKNVLSLEEARRRLAQLQEDVKSRAATNDASLAVVREKRTKAQLAMQRAQQVIDSLVIKAPFDGVVSLKENRDAAGGMIFWGMVLPEYRAGDQISPGRPVVDVIESGLHGGASQGRRERSAEPGGGSGRGRRGRRPSGRDVQGADRGARRPCEPRQFLGIGGRHTAVRPDAEVRPSRQPAQGRCVGTRDARRQGGRRCAPRAAAGGVRQEREELHLRQDRRAFRSARSESGAAHREPRRALGCAGRDRDRPRRSELPCARPRRRPPLRPFHRRVARDERRRG